MEIKHAASQKKLLMNNSKIMKPLMLIVEKSQGELWGRVHYEDDLLVTNARTVESLERKMKTLLKDFHELEPRDVQFERHYDLTAVFEKFDYLKISTIAELAEINPALLRQYASGIKHPSAKQAKKVEHAIHKIGAELSKFAVYAPNILLILAATLGWLFC